MVLNLIALLLKPSKAALWGLAIGVFLGLVWLSYGKHEQAKVALIAETEGRIRLEMLNADLSRAAALRNRVAVGRADKRLQPTAPSGDQRGYRD